MGKVIEPLTIEMMFGNFSKILKTGGQHHSVREAVILAICKQISNFSDRKDLQKISPSLQAFLAELTRNELDQIAKKITEIYLEQRKSFKDGDREIKVNGSSYQIWLNSERPYTEIEKVLMQWLGDEEYPIAQQFAMQAQVNFAIALDKDEETIIEQIRKEQINDEGNNEEFNTLETVKRRSFILDKLIAAFVTLFAQPSRPIIRNILPEAFEQNKSRKDVINFILNKWQSYTNQGDKIGGQFNLVTTSNRLRLGLWLAENRLWIIIWLIVVGGFLPVTIINNYVANYPIQSTQNNLSKEEVLTLIQKFLEAKSKFYAYPFDKELVAQFTTSMYHEEITKQGGVIDNLKQNNQHYQYISQKAEPLEYFSIYNTSNHVEAEIDVKITEIMHLYENNIYKEDKSYSNSYRFTLKQENGIWKISNRVSLK